MLAEISNDSWNATYLLAAVGRLLRGHLGSTNSLGTHTGKPEKLVTEGFSSSAVKNGRAVNPLLYFAFGSLIRSVGPFLILIAPSKSSLSMTPEAAARSN